MFKQLLDSLDYGLGMAVLTRYTEEFFHPEALDIWQVFLAYLQSIRFSDNMVRLSQLTCDRAVNGSM